MTITAMDDAVVQSLKNRRPGGRPATGPATGGGAGETEMTQLTEMVQDPGMPQKQNAKTAQQGAADNDRVLRRLDRAVGTGDLVRIHRSIRCADRVEGFVIGTSAAWTLLAPCPDIQLDGWTAVRTADITKVRRRGDGTCLTVRALHRRGQWPVRMPAHAVPLDGLPDLVEAACRGFGLVSLHVERHVPNACWIGAVTGLRPKSLRLREVDTGARWRTGETKFRFEDITRVDFGGRYEQTLREFAGPCR